MRRNKTIERRVGLAVLSAVALFGLSSCGVVARSIRESATGFASPGPRHAEWGRAAWQYFKSARNGTTGLVDVSAGAGFTTPAAIGDHLAAAVSAHRLGLIDDREFDAHVSQILQFLVQAPLSAETLPARYYGTADGKPMDPPRGGVDPGWSAVDTGRLLVWLRILADRYPTYASYVVRIGSRLRPCRAVDAQGRLLRALPGEGGLAVSEERGNAYAVYGAQGFRAWGQQVASPSYPGGDFAIEVSGVTFPIPESAEAGAPELTAPYALLAVEFGGSAPGGRTLGAEMEAAERVAAAQLRRTSETAIPTARTDYRRGSDPYEVIDSVLTAGYPWSTTTRAGQAVPGLALTSTRAAFGLWAMGALPKDSVTFDAVSTLYDPSSGWFEGRYEAGGGYEYTRTSATNAFVLEALLHAQTGRLYEVRRPLPPVEGAPESGQCLFPALAS